MTFFWKKKCPEKKKILKCCLTAKLWQQHNLRVNVECYLGWNEFANGIPLVFWKVCLFMIVLKHMDSLQVSDGGSVDKLLNPFSLSFAMQESLTASAFLFFFAFSPLCCDSYFRPSYYQITNSFLFLSFNFLHAPPPHRVLKLPALEALNVPWRTRTLLYPLSWFWWVVRTW